MVKLAWPSAGNRAGKADMEKYIVGMIEMVISNQI